ncbi:MAG: hypothetical protein U9N59_09310 [Campylobacterota bacterium]|nr:hypothetical protein [Campylobacterota bacterium]
MLSYRRRSSTAIASDVNITDVNRFLITYCNWSYASQYHIDESTLVNILTSFNTQYIPFYLRIFNETPLNILTSFIESHNISMQQIQNLHDKLNHRSGLRVKELLVA